MVRCRGCGHVYASPKLADIYANYTDVADENYLQNEPLRTATAREVLKTIRRHQPEGRLIDVGCSTGDFLVAAREYYDVEGLELSDWASEIARDKGLTVHSKLLADFIGEQRRYNVATFWGVIEHLEEPLIEMRRIHQILEPGGIVCIWTGDVDSIHARVLGANWWYVMGQHIHLFSRKSLNQVMRHAGFELIEESVYPYVMSYGYLGERLLRYPVIGPLAKLILGSRLFSGKTFNLKLFCEIFSVYRKIDAARILNISSSVPVK